MPILDESSIQVGTIVECKVLGKPDLVLGDVVDKFGVEWLEENFEYSSNGIYHFELIEESGDNFYASFLLTDYKDGHVAYQISDFGTQMFHAGDEEDFVVIDLDADVMTHSTVDKLLTPMKYFSSKRSEPDVTRHEDAYKEFLVSLIELKKSPKFSELELGYMYSQLFEILNLPLKCRIGY